VFITIYINIQVPCIGSS